MAKRRSAVQKAKVRQFTEFVQMSHATIQDLFTAAQELQPKDVREGVFEYLRTAESAILCAQLAAVEGLRLDQMQDKEMEALMRQCVMQGHMQPVGKNEEGETTYRLTDQGRKYVENMIGSRRH